MNNPKRAQAVTTPATTAVVLKSPQVSTPTSDPAERDPLDVIAEEFAELCRGGKTPSVSDFKRRYPAYADDLENLLPAVGQMESLKRLRRSDGLAPAEALPERIGDFKIVREIGRGGMGVVLEAEQVSLRRKVALKILPTAARNDPVKRERFLREAQAAARLHHTHIVPVFGVGDDNGVPYYVMQYIRGCGLDDVIHGWKNHHTDPVVRQGDWRTIARLLACAAEAVDYAHSEGVLHRDLKPGNLLLDAQGHLWITDFGLAKLLDEHTLTVTGQVLGTIQYMAPETLTGQSDERSDVYGLGMTLYEMLTGRLPLAETNPAALVRRIGTEDPPPPRAVEPSVPRGLETICLKAIAREPSRRYGSAAELADDLRAYLVGRPLSARRLSPIGRTLLWCRRNPLVAGLSAAIVVTLSLSTVFAWWQYGRTKRALQNETQALAKAEEYGKREKALRIEADQASAKYRENLEMSLAAIEKILDIAGRGEPMLGRPGYGPPPENIIGARERGPTPRKENGQHQKEERGPREPEPERGQPPRGMKPPKGLGEIDQGPAALPRVTALSNNAELLDEILAFYEKFAEQNATNAKLRFDAARAYRRVAEIQFVLGRREKGEAAIRTAVRMFEELREVHPDPELIRWELELIRHRGERHRPIGPPKPGPGPKND